MKFTTRIYQTKIKFIPEKLIYIFLFVSIFSSCREEPPLIYFNLYSGSDSTYITNNIPTAQFRNSLMEDYTGVRCANCPDAHDAARNLANSHNGRMIILSMYPTDNLLTRPYTTIAGNQDFRMVQARDLLTVFGSDKNLPSIGLDRIVNSSKKKFLTNSVGDWSSVLDAQIGLTNSEKTSPLNINIVNELKPSNDSLKITCFITATSNVPDSVYLTLVMLEDSITNPQENSLGDVDTFYKHNNVARGFITSTYGTYLKTNFIVGRVYRKQITIPVYPNIWKLNNCKVLAFVHRAVNTNSNSEIWHSVTQKVK